MPTEFTPLAALAGGLLIGAAILVLFHTLGRIAGVSGMISGAFRSSTPGSERAWRFAFLGGLLLGPVAASQLTSQALVQPSPASLPLLIVAGLAVGLGTGMANGCTSGHGVCGVSRLSPRSLVATGVFMGFGFLTASVGRHLLIGG
ncbi:YeeE/YedE thiosulfate transporter family protein [Phenylobacterium sp.]|uniref:YeeE/YedE family protein n=1 Tax=Phenylobacterium sp. TaxID=1871053 RepID=UPI002605AE57|nr:YeeE/YedE thiosulfate transporter family protein [Phenylobacterium sp.]